MGLFFIWLALTIGFMFLCFILNDIKIELRYRNILMEKQNQLLKHGSIWDYKKQQQQNEQLY